MLATELYGNGGRHVMHNLLERDMRTEEPDTVPSRSAKCGVKLRKLLRGWGERI